MTKNNSFYSQEKFDAERVIDFYTNVYDESQRLIKDRRHIVEYETKKDALKTFIMPGSVIYDVGAGTGVWSKFLLENIKDVRVMAFDLVPAHVEKIKNELREHNGFLGAEVLNVADDKQLLNMKDRLPKADIVLLGGPLYHISDYTKRIHILFRMSELIDWKCEHMNGLLCVDWLSSMNAAMETMLSNDTTPNRVNITHGNGCHPANDNMFAYSSVLEMETMGKKAGLEVQSHIPLDGISRLVGDRLNQMNEENFEKWVQMHKFLGINPTFCNYSEHNMTIFYRK